MKINFDGTSFNCRFVSLDELTTDFIPSSKLSIDSLVFTFSNDLSALFIFRVLPHWKPSKSRWSSGSKLSFLNGFQSLRCTTSSLSNSPQCFNAKIFWNILNEQIETEINKIWKEFIFLWTDSSIFGEKNYFFSNFLFFRRFFLKMCLKFFNSLCQKPKKLCLTEIQKVNYHWTIKTFSVYL